MAVVTTLSAAPGAMAAGSRYPLYECSTSYPPSGYASATGMITHAPIGVRSNQRRRDRRRPLDRELRFDEEFAGHADHGHIVDPHDLDRDGDAFRSTVLLDALDQHLRPLHLVARRVEIVRGCAPAGSGPRVWLLVPPARSARSAASGQGQKRERERHLARGHAVWSSRVHGLLPNQVKRGHRSDPVVARDGGARVDIQEHLGGLQPQHRRRRARPP